MGEFIEDGTGRGYLCKVGDDNRLQADALTHSEEESQAREGNAYNINTGDITLTTANESGVLYIKNNESKDLIVESCFYLLGSSTGGSGETRIDIYRNPTAGTVVSDATAVAYNQNRNFGSSKTLTADCYKGDEGKTFTDGDIIISSLISPPKREVLKIALVLPQGTSIGFTVTPATSNTSQTLQIAVGCHLLEDH